jgi:hypothetical protein
VELLDDWTSAVCDTLDLGPVTDQIDSGLVLQMARDIAHTLSRPAAPLSAYLLGLAVGRGADPVQAASEITQLAQRWPPDAS